MDVALFALAYLYWYIVFAYAVWWLIVLARGQTPASRSSGWWPSSPTGRASDGAGCSYARCSRDLLVCHFGLGVIVDIILLVLSDQPRTVADRVAGSTIVHVSG